MSAREKARGSESERGGGREERRVKGEGEESGEEERAREEGGRPEEETDGGRAKVREKERPTEGEGQRDAGGRSVGYRSVRVLLQRPTGQRITRNSRLDSAEFERAPADLASLHRFALLCALSSPRLSPRLSQVSPLLSSLTLSLSLPLTALSRISFAVGTR